MLPNGFNVYPEDIENALRIAGIRDPVVLETDPAGSRRSCCARGRDPARRRRIAASATRRRGQGGQCQPGPDQRVAGWRRWPDEDFPRTHTLKIKRDPVRHWLAESGAPVGNKRS